MKLSSSLPKDFEERMRSMLNVEYDLFVQALKQPAITSIRSNPKKHHQLTGESIPWCSDGIYLNKRPSFTLDPSFHAGAYYVQEASSMLVEQAIKQTTDLSKPLKVLDLCAAPGGKSTLLLSIISSESLLVANEVIRSRCGVLMENIQKWGSNNVVVTNNDPAAFTKLTGYFDIILVDAPCSGEGLFRRDEEAMNEWSLQNVEHCSIRQKRILTDVIPALKKDGLLIYSTCTYSEEENENNLQWLASHPELSSIKLKMDSSWGVTESEKNNIYGYRCFPHKTKGEGFFIAAYRKINADDSIRIRTKTNYQTPNKKIISSINHWLEPDKISLIQKDQVILAIPENYEQDINFLDNHCHVLLKGTSVAEVKHDKLIPEHALAISDIISTGHFSVLHLEKSQALQYLRKETFPVNTIEQGYTIVKYMNNNLGWINQLSNRFNNLYPPAWRIRMDIGNY